MFKPPMRNGISASQVFIQKHIAVNTIYDYLCLKFAHISPMEWQQRFNDGLIYQQNGQILQANTPYSNLVEQKIYYYRALAKEIPVPFAHHILYENENLIVVDKPHFLTVSPTGKYVQQTLLTRLKQQFNCEHLTPIHRLDRETAGLILFCKNPHTRGQYQQLFASREIDKIYHAIAPYQADLTFPQTVQLHLQKGDPFYTMQIIPNQTANSWTDIDLLQEDGQWAKYRLQLHTGKQHQLRVHLNYLGIPIKNDPFYPIVCHKADDDFSQPLQLLAKSLAFQDPISGEGLEFCSRFELVIEDNTDH